MRRSTIYQGAIVFSESLCCKLTVQFLCCERRFGKDKNSAYRLVKSMDYCEVRFSFSNLSFGQMIFDKTYHIRLPDFLILGGNAMRLMADNDMGIFI